MPGNRRRNNHWRRINLSALADSEHSLPYSSSRDGIKNSSFWSSSRDSIKNSSFWSSSRDSFKEPLFWLSSRDSIKNSSFWSSSRDSFKEPPFWSSSRYGGEDSPSPSSSKSVPVTVTSKIDSYLSIGDELLVGDGSLHMSLNVKGILSIAFENGYSLFGKPSPLEFEMAIMFRQKYNLPTDL